MPILLSNVSDNYKKYTDDPIDATGANTSNSFTISDLATGTIQVVHAGHTVGSSIWELQMTLDGSNWDTIVGTSQSTSGASGSKTLVLDPMPGGRLRLAVTTPNGTPGATLTVYVEGRKGGN